MPWEWPAGSTPITSARAVRPRHPCVRRRRSPACVGQCRVSALELSFYMPISSCATPIGRHGPFDRDSRAVRRRRVLSRAGASDRRRSAVTKPEGPACCGRGARLMKASQSAASRCPCTTGWARLRGRGWRPWALQVRAAFAGAVPAARRRRTTMGAATHSSFLGAACGRSCCGAGDAQLALRRMDAVLVHAVHGLAIVVASNNGSRRWAVSRDC